MVTGIQLDDELCANRSKKGKIPLTLIERHKTTFKGHLHNPIDNVFNNKYVNRYLQIQKLFL